MSEQNSSNVQVQPPVTPAATGPNVAELQAKIEELERQSEGRLRDLQNERNKRQELEQRVTPPASSPANQDVSGNELDQVIAPSVERRLAPVMQELEELRREKALQHLSSKTGKTADEILKDTKLQEKLIATARKFNLVGNTYDVTTRAYEIMELESLREQQAERTRAAQAASQSSLPSGAPAASVSGVREYSPEDFKKLPAKEFDALYASGSLKKVGDKIVYTPK